MNLRNHHGQMSESLLTASFIILSGGLQDAYTYLCRGKVFANAQTGNIVLCSAYLFDGQWRHSARYLIPVLSFLLGIFAAECIHRHFKYTEKVHWRQMIILAEIALLFAVGFLPQEARTMEPALAETVRGALLAPTAAIVDPWGLCLAAAETAVRNGAELKRGSAVAGVEDLGDHYVVHTASGNYESRYLVNCAGVHGHEISAMVGESEWMPKHSRGEYYLLDKSSGDLVNHVIFQCPSVLGKGVLVAPTVHGNLIVGPNAEPVEDGDDRATTQSGLDQVAAFGRKSVPSIDLRQSIRNFSGVRAVTSEEDFIIRPAKNSPRMLYVCGIKSPGLSAAPAIADYALEKLKEMGLAAEKKTMWSGKRTQIRFRKLSDSEKAELVRKDPRYGRIICRCETITEGEIIAAIHSPIPPCSIDGVKRRTGAGMGRCQGGFCGPRVLKILADELGKDPMEIVQDGSATWLLMEETKGGSGK